MYLGFEGNGGIKRKGKVIRDNILNLSNCKISNSITFMLQKIEFNFFFKSQALLMHGSPADFIATVSTEASR